MSKQDEVSQGLVAKRIQQINGGECVARPPCRTAATKEVPAVKPVLAGLAFSSLPRQEPAEPSALFSPICTPREGPPPSARSALRMSNVAESARRNSRVSFAREVGLDLGEESEADMGLSDNEDETSTSLDPATISTFALDDSDDGSCEEDLDDIYDFDHDKLADMVKSGADRLQLATVVEDAMAAALERKLARKAGKEPREAKDLAAAVATNAWATQENWDLDGRMTPTEEAPVPIEDVAERARQALVMANSRRRRSSAAKKHTFGIEEAMKGARERRRQSLAQKYNTMGDAHGQISEAMERARGRHRQSMSKAADVLESAGYDDDTVECSETTKKMRLLQQAMEDARQRHRRSIARAVQALEEPQAVPMLNANANVFNPQLCCGAGVDSPVLQPDWQHAATSNECNQAAAWGNNQQNHSMDNQQGVWNNQECNQQGYDNQQSHIVDSQQAGWNNQQCNQQGYDNQQSHFVDNQQAGWDTQQCNQQGYVMEYHCPSSSVQARISQAVSSAYQHHCYEQDYSQQCYTDPAHMQANPPNQAYQQNECKQLDYSQQGSQMQFPEECGQQFGAQYDQNNYHSGAAQPGVGQQQQQQATQYGSGQQQQQIVHEQQSCGQQFGAQYAENNYHCGAAQQGVGQQQQVINTQQSCDQQFGTQYGQNSYHVEADQQGFGQQQQENCGQQFGAQYGQEPNHQQQAYNQQGCGQQFGGQYVNWDTAKDNKSWPGQQMYSAPWRLGSA